METIYLAGGCFWGVQKYFDQFEGVISTETGYANGPDRAPSYRDVCGGSGHAETVEITYDPSVISLAEILNAYFRVIDPLSVNRQGEDSGIQYRTGIYYTDGGQLPEIEKAMRELEEKLGTKTAVEVAPLRNFFTAEEYHQKYLDKNPGGYCHIPREMLHLSSPVVQVAVLSDTHGLLSREVVKEVQDCSCILHAGDIVRESDLDELRLYGNVYAVRGNNDRWQEGLKDLAGVLRFEIAGVSFLMTHEQRDVPRNLEGVQAVILGHTHRYSEEWADGRLWLNPGSCGPSRFGGEATMAKLRLQAGRILEVRKIRCAF